MSLPSPLYTLLANNDWGDRHSNGLEAIASGLTVDGWDFDVHETHGGVSLLRALIQGWSTHKGRPSDLLRLASHLLDRGADPASAFQCATGQIDQVRWSDHAPLASLLKSRISPSVPSDNLPLGVALLSIVSQQGTASELAAAVKALLATHQGHQTRIQGLRAVPWLALHAAFVRGSTELLGWGRPYSSQSESNVLQMRVFKKLVATDKTRPQWTDLERWGVASAAVARCDSMGGTAGEQSVCNQLKAQALKLCQGVDVEAVLQDGAPALPQDLRLRLAASTLASREHLGWEAGWGAVRSALPLVFEGDVSLLGDELLGRVFPVFYKSTETLDKMWAGWDFDRHASYAQALTVWKASWRELGAGTAYTSIRAQWLNGLAKKLENHPQQVAEALALPVTTLVSTGSGNVLDVSGEMEEHNAILRAFALKHSWQQPLPSPSRPRM